MKIIIAGSRFGITYEKFMAGILNSGFSITEIVEGEAPGVDQMAKDYARVSGIPFTPFFADWNNPKLGKGAGHIRNKQMGDYADALIAFPVGRSPGTWNMITYMKKLGKPVYVYGN